MTSSVPTIDTTGWKSGDYARHYTGKLGWGLVPVPEKQKAPRHRSWNDAAKAITDPERAYDRWSASAENMGVLHSASHTLVLDIDDPEGTHCALASVELDLQALLNRNPFRTKGLKGEKPYYRVPQGMTLTRKVLQWPADPQSGSSNSKHTVFELRAGAIQDLLPPSVHPQTGRPYEWVQGPPPSREDLPEVPEELLCLIQQWAMLEPLMRDACPWADGTPEKATSAPDLPFAGDSIIDKFNRQHHPREILERHGYRRIGVDRWLCPGSTTGSPGVKLLPDVSRGGYPQVFSNHGSDPLNDGHAHDAFSVFKILDHHGDLTAAVRTARALLDASQEPVWPSTQQEAWPLRESLPPLATPVPALSEDLVPEGVRGWLTDASHRMNVPLGMLAIPALVAAGSVIGLHVQVRPKQHDTWTVISNFWGAIVGPPSVMKSAVLREGTRFIRKLEQEAFKEVEDIRAECEAQLEVLTAQLEQVQGRLKRADADDVAGLREELLALREEQQALKQRLLPRRLVVNDVTPEKLLELLRQSPNGLLQFRDEMMGWIHTLQRAGREGERPMYLEAWNGNGSFTQDRLGRGTIHVKNVRLAMLGGIQPGPLIEQTKSARGQGDDGLLQRFQLLVWPDALPEYQENDRPPDLAAIAQAERVIRFLDGLRADDFETEQDEDGHALLRFSPDAQMVFNTWRAELEAKLRSRELQEHLALQAHLAKYRSLLPALALLLHLCECAIRQDQDFDRHHIGVNSAQSAARWCAFLEAHARKVWGADRDPTVQAAWLLVEAMQTGRLHTGMKLRDVLRAKWSGLTDANTVKQGLGLLERLGHVRQERQEHPNGGRPSIVVHLHPAYEADDA
ncbi:DUF3987 domain-containing protein [Deinococcus pimensis]|uniref:DUF3987 domain-containing protein n=1 Tax=Deinococcus pimensis TaxID=309888 RepID=UPI0004B8101F|nr:DUF3987 domain-containing protein [Deinococcus pimensis]